jgi:phosphatidylethanolamine N-methyltransferase
MWVPVHDEVWDGDLPVAFESKIASSSKDSESGQVVFSGNALPWKVGQYEVSLS